MSAVITRHGRPVALTWLLPDESSDRTDALAGGLEHEDAHVPAIWPLEVSNALIMALRRRRISGAECKRCVAALSALPIELDATAALIEVLASAQRFELTSYDAAYLELAQRRTLPLATLDTKLREACRTLKIHVAP